MLLLQGSARGNCSPWSLARAEPLERGSCARDGCPQLLAQDINIPGMAIRDHSIRLGLGAGRRLWCSRRAFGGLLHIGWHRASVGEPSGPDEEWPYGCQGNRKDEQAHCGAGIRLAPPDKPRPANRFTREARHHPASEVERRFHRWILRLPERVDSLRKLGQLASARVAGGDVLLHGLPQPLGERALDIRYKILSKASASHLSSPARASEARL